MRGLDISPAWCRRGSAGRSYSSPGAGRWPEPGSPGPRGPAGSGSSPAGGQAGCWSWRRKAHFERELFSSGSRSGRGWRAGLAPEHGISSPPQFGQTLRRWSSSLRERIIFTKLYFAISCQVWSLTTYSLYLYKEITPSTSIFSSLSTSLMSDTDQLLCWHQVAWSVIYKSLWLSST